MTTGVLATPPILSFTYNNGQLAAGGYIAPTVGGVPTAVYQDIGLTTPLPLTAIPNQSATGVPLNSRGEISNASGASCQLFLTPNIVYTFTLYDSSGNQIWVATYVNGVQSSITQAIIGQLLYPQSSAEGAAGITPASYQYPYEDSRRFNFDLTGGTNNTTLLQGMLNAAGIGAADTGLVNEVTLWPGTYLVNRIYINYSNVFLKIMPGAIIKQTQTGIINQNSTGQTPAYAVIHVNPLSYTCNPSSAITAIDNVKVYGGGTIQGPYTATHAYDGFAMGIVSNDCNKCWVTDLNLLGCGGENILLNPSAWNTCLDLRIIGNEVQQGGEVGINNARAFLVLHNYVHDSWVQNGLGGDGDTGLVCFNRVRNMAGNGMSVGGSGAKDVNACTNVILGFNVIENTNLTSGGGYAIFLTDDGATTTPKIGIKAVGNIVNLNQSGTGAMIGADYAMSTGLVDIENNTIIGGTSSGTNTGIAVIAGAAHYSLRDNTFAVGAGNMSVCMDVLGGTPVVDVWSYDNKDVATDFGHPALFNVIDTQRLLNPTLTLTGCTTAPTMTAKAVKRNKTVTLAFTGLSAASNSTGCTLTGLPAELTPVGSQNFPLPIESSGGVVAGLMQVGSSGVITLFSSIAGGAFANDGLAKGMAGPYSITYLLD